MLSGYMLGLNPNWRIALIVYLMGNSQLYHSSLRTLVVHHGADRYLKGYPQACTEEKKVGICSKRKVVLQRTRFIEKQFLSSDLTLMSWTRSTE